MDKISVDTKAHGVEGEIRQVRQIEKLTCSFLGAAMSA